MCISVVPPTRRNVFSSRNLRSLAWSIGDISEISSRKDRPARGLLEQADLALLGVGERPPFVTEQLALEQRLWERGARDVHEGRAAAVALRVDGPRYDVLPSSALSRN